MLSASRIICGNSDTTAIRILNPPRRPSPRLPGVPSNRLAEGAVAPPAPNILVPRAPPSGLALESLQNAALHLSRRRPDSPPRSQSGLRDRNPYRPAAAIQREAPGSLRLARTSL